MRKALAAAWFIAPFALFALIATGVHAEVRFGRTPGSPSSTICVYDLSATRPCVSFMSVNDTTHVLSLGGTTAVGAFSTVTATGAITTGTVGGTLGTVNFKGTTSGTASLVAQAVAGTPTVKMPTTSGTVAVSATSPILVDPATGNITCPTCGTIAGKITIQKFTADGTYTPNAFLVFGTVELCGGGGGSGGIGTASNVQSGGGGSGGYRKAAFVAADIGASKPVTVGAGGLAGAAGANTGGTGGTTSLGSLASALGGLGSIGNNTMNSRVAGGAGAAAGSGSLAAMLDIPGMDGQVAIAPTTVFFSIAGNGGSVAGGFGSGGFGQRSISTPQVGQTGGFCSGGGGTAEGTGTTATAGAPGGPGLVVITEYNSQ